MYCKQQQWFFDDHFFRSPRDTAKRWATVYFYAVSLHYVKYWTMLYYVYHKHAEKLMKL